MGGPTNSGAAFWRRSRQGSRTTDVTYPRGPKRACYIVPLLITAALAACSDRTDARATVVPRTGVLGSWSGPAVANEPTPQATAVVLPGARPAVVEAEGSELRILEPSIRALTVHSTLDLGAPVVWMQPRVDGDSIIVLAQTCPTPLSTVDTVDSDCPSKKVLLVTFSGRDLVPSVETVGAEGVPTDLAVLGRVVGVTTTAGFFLRSAQGDWTRLNEPTGSSCATDEALVQHENAPVVPPTTTATRTEATVPGESIQVEPLVGGIATEQHVPGHIGSLTCAPGGYLLSVSTGTDITTGVTFWGTKGTGTPEDKGGPQGSMPTIEGQLSRGQWARATVGIRRTVFIDPTTGHWFASLGLKGSETPPFATRSGDRGIVFAPAPGGGTWTLRAYRLGG